MKLSKLQRRTYSSRSMLAGRNSLSDRLPSLLINGLERFHMSATQSIHRHYELISTSWFVNIVSPSLSYCNSLQYFYYIVLDSELFRNYLFTVHQLSGRSWFVSHSFLSYYSQFISRKSNKERHHNIGYWFNYSTQNSTSFLPSSISISISTLSVSPLISHPCPFSSHLSFLFYFLCIFVFRLTAPWWNEGFEMITVILLPYLETQTQTPYPPTHICRHRNTN